jgi:hypothetical protein
MVRENPDLQTDAHIDRGSEGHGVRSIGFLKITSFLRLPTFDLSDPTQDEHGILSQIRTVITKVFGCLFTRLFSGTQGQNYG